MGNTFNSFEDDSAPEVDTEPDTAVDPQVEEKVGNEFEKTADDHHEYREVAEGVQARVMTDDERGDQLGLNKK